MITRHVLLYDVFPTSTTIAIGEKNLFMFMSLLSMGISLNLFNSDDFPSVNGITWYLRQHYVDVNMPKSGIVVIPN